MHRTNELVLELKKITAYAPSMKLKRKEFERAIRWYVMTVFMVAGSACFFIASAEDNIRPVWIGFLCFGIVFIIMSVWKTIRNQILLITLCIVVASSFAAKYLPFYAYQWTGFVIDINYYVLWSLVIFVVGIPIMTVSFDVFDE